MGDSGHPNDGDKAEREGKHSKERKHREKDKERHKSDKHKDHKHHKRRSGDEARKEGGEAASASDKKRKLPAEERPDASAERRGGAEAPPADKKRRLPDDERPAVKAEHRDGHEAAPAGEKKRRLTEDEQPGAKPGRSGSARMADAPRAGGVVGASAADDDRPGAGRAGAPGPAPAPGEAAPDALKPQLQDAGGEVSMSVEETNRVRISLGLKPLVIGDGGAAKAEFERHAAERAEAARRAQADELAERVKAQREKRVEQAKLRATKTLGEAAPDVDDLAAWVGKSRALEESRRAEERAKADKAARMLAQQDEEAGASEDDEADEHAGGAALGAAELAGMRVRHSAEELGAGETLVMTLADRPVLDARGELADDADELENPLAMEQKQRDRAKRAAAKGTNEPLFGEDGRARGMLDKYDEEGAAAGMRVGADGALEAEDTARRQAEIRARLAAAESAASLARDGAADARSEYYTAEEMAEFAKPKKKKLRKKNLRKKLDASDIAALEAEAAAAGAGDHGSRAAAGSRADADAAQIAAEAARKEERYANALAKANYASLALRPDGGAGAGGGGGAPERGEEDDEELQATLARARRAALAKAAAAEAAGGRGGVGGEDALASRAAARREADERERTAEVGLAFTEAAEFARGIHVAAPDEAPAEAGALHMGVDEADPNPTPAPAADPPKKPAAWGAWVAAGEGGEGGAAAAAADADMADVEAEEEDGAAEEDGSLVREKPVGSGLAGALALLKERGDLAERVEWSGRINDMRRERMGDLTDVYTEGRHEERIAADIERALTERDEFGRVLTPRERFRRLCYRFHGIPPSKNTQDKRARKLAEEVAKKRASAAEAPDADAAGRLATLQAQTATPYLVLSGKVRPGQTSDARSGYGTAEQSAAALTPMLGGGQTPLTGARKVEAMLGLGGGGGGGGSRSMAPPAPRRKP